MLNKKAGVGFANSGGKLGTIPALRQRNVENSVSVHLPQALLADCYFGGDSVQSGTFGYSACDVLFVAAVCTPFALESDQTCARFVHTTSGAKEGGPKGKFAIH
jgi:hypothetical protein